MLFFLLCAGVETCARFFTGPLRQSWPMAKADRKAVEGTIDTVFIGGSLFRNGIVPSLFDKTMKGRSFSYTTSNQPLPLSRYALEDLSRSNPIKLALIDLSVNRLVREDGAGSGIVKYILFNQMFDMQARIDLLRDQFTTDELLLTLFQSARDQTHYFLDDSTLRDRISAKTLKEYLKYGYSPDPDYVAGSMGYTPSHTTIPEGNVKVRGIEKIPENPDVAKNLEALAQLAAMCREKGITPVFMAMPTTDAAVLFSDRYPLLMKPVKALAERLGVLYLDFNLSKFRVSSMSNVDFADIKHMNHTGAERFTPYFASVLQKALAGEDVSSYFYPSYDEMILDIDPIAAVLCSLIRTDEGLRVRATSLQGPSITPVYRFYIKPLGGSGSEYQPLESTGNECSLSGLAPGTYRVRAEACRAAGLRWEAFDENTLTIGG